MPPRVRPSLRQPTPTPQRDDAGFAVLEALVSFVILALVSAAALGAILSLSNESKVSSGAVNANYLAEQELQVARAIAPSKLAAPTTRQSRVGSTLYTVQRAATPACAAAPTYDANYVAYTLVTATVSWASTQNSRQNGRQTSVSVSAELAC